MKFIVGYALHREKTEDYSEAVATGTFQIRARDITEAFSAASSLVLDCLDSYKREPNSELVIKVKKAEE